MSIESLANKLMTVGIIGGVFFVIYSKVRGQSFSEIIEDIKRLFSFGEEKIEEKIKK